ncbi:hypothetical protein Anapl_00415 [Anas platyrhynchos]|uniref:Uncharacterized protein n=1 Tax=Anas platyrhynchos TaxID=8839 RepID=R0L629_ANAPL|nr:hypothetical protein Anapl_00415 [Anas platyrhynchos]
MNVTGNTGLGCLNSTAPPGNSSPVSLCDREEELESPLGSLLHSPFRSHKNTSTSQASGILWPYTSLHQLLNQRKKKPLTASRPPLTIQAEHGQAVTTLLRDSWKWLVCYPSPHHSNLSEALKETRRRHFSLCRCAPADSGQGQERKQQNSSRKPDPLSPEHGQEALEASRESFSNEILAQSCRSQIKLNLFIREDSSGTEQSIARHVPALASLQVGMVNQAQVLAGHKNTDTSSIVVAEFPILADLRLHGACNTLVLQKADYKSCRSLGYTNIDWLKESREGAGSTATAGSGKEIDRDSVILPCQSDPSQERVHLTARASSNILFAHTEENRFLACAKHWPFITISSMCP